MSICCGQSFLHLRDDEGTKDYVASVHEWTAKLETHTEQTEIWLPLRYSQDNKIKAIISKLYETSNLESVLRV